MCVGQKAFKDMSDAELGVIMAGLLVDYSNYRSAAREIARRGTVDVASHLIDRFSESTAESS